MSFNSQGSVTTTGLKVGDNEQFRNPIQTDADRNAADGGKQMPAPKYAGSGINQGIAASQPSELRSVTVKPVDRKTIAGSTPGDFRNQPGDTAKASVARAADNGGPRQPMRGQKNSKYSNEDNPTFQNFGGVSTDSDAGN